MGSIEVSLKESRGKEGRGKEGGFKQIKGKKVRKERKEEMGVEEKEQGRSEGR